MNKEWMLSPEELAECQFYEEPDNESVGYERNIANRQAKKLLEHLIAHPDKGEWTEEDKQDCIKIRTIKSMLKQLEEKDV